LISEPFSHTLPHSSRKDTKKIKKEILSRNPLANTQKTNKT
jgi:hypothetical protein